MEFTIKDGKLVTDFPDGLQELNCFLGALETAAKKDQSWASKFSQVVDAIREQNLQQVSIRVESSFRESNGVSKKEALFSGGTLVHEFIITGD